MNRKNQELEMKIEKMIEIMKKEKINQKLKLLLKKLQNKQLRNNLPKKKLKNVVEKEEEIKIIRIIIIEIVDTNQEIKIKEINNRSKALDLIQMMNLYSLNQVDLIL